jgi:hypothetical protein
MHEAVFVVLLIAVAAGTFAIKRGVYVYGRKKRAAGTAGPMTRRLYGPPGTDAKVHINRAGFVAVAVVLTAALVLFDQWGGGIYSGTTNAVTLVVGMALIVVVGLARWDKNHQSP